MKHIVLIAHNLRSTHNVGSLLRTAEGLGVEKVFLTGYTPYGKIAGDTRLPHITAKLDAQIAKTALGAETMIEWQHEEDITSVIRALQADGYQVAALEQTTRSIPLPEFTPKQKITLVIGREVEGIEPEVLKLCDMSVEIPMRGQKESFNVVQAAAMALYQMTHLG